MLRDLLKEGAKPETVILVFFLGNDFRDNYMDWVRRSEVGWMGSYVVSQIVGYRKVPTEQFEMAFRKTGEALDELKALCAEQARRLLVVGLPGKAEVLQSVKDHPRWPEGLERTVFEWEGEHSQFSFDGPNERLGEMLHVRGIEYVSLLASFRAHAREGLYGDQDPHWTPRGEELAAEIVADYLRR